MQAQLKQYQQTQISTASGEKIVLMLYDGAINYSRLAVENAAKGDRAGRGKYISKAQAIVAHLMDSLDHKIGGDITKRLNQLYMYIIQEYVNANVNNSVTPLGNAIKILGMMRETWIEAIEIVKKERETGTILRSRIN
jgi:flagellar protein FliS